MKRCKACGADVADGVVRCNTCISTERALRRRLPYFEGPEDLVMDTRDMVYQRMPNGELRRIGRLNK